MQLGYAGGRACEGVAGQGHRGERREAVADVREVQQLVKEGQQLREQSLTGHGGREPLQLPLRQRGAGGWLTTDAERDLIETGQDLRKSKTDAQRGCGCGGCDGAGSVGC